MSTTNVSHVGSRFASCVNRTFSCFTPIQARVLFLGLLAVSLLTVAWLAYHCRRQHPTPFTANRQPPESLGTPRPGEEIVETANGREIGIRRDGQLTKGTKAHNTGLIASESGTFQLGRLHGRDCRRVMRNGIVYEGEFINGNLVDGTKTYPSNSRDDSGNVIQHQSIRGRFDEHARLFGEDCEVIGIDQSVCRGRFHRGEFVQGVQEFVNGPIRRREGTFNNNSLHGENCTEVRLDEDEKTITLRGTFDQGDLTEGSITYQSGDVEQKRGTFSNLILSGHTGTVIYFDRKMLQGRFDDRGRLVEGTKTFVNESQNSSRRTETGSFTTPEVGASHLCGKDGFVEYFNGDRLNGAFNNEGSLINGIKTYSHPTKDGVIREEGRFNNNNLINGQKTYQSGRIVHGTFDDAGLWHGQMTILENQKTHTGEYLHNHLQGQLTETDSHRNIHSSHLVQSNHPAFPHEEK